jgi:hypothetical protein
MRLLLLLLMIVNMTAHAGPEWAYCDGSNRAYKTVKRVVRDCPSPQRPGEPHVGPVVQDPERCPARTVTAIVNHPELDYICAYPTASESDDPELRNTTRCINADKKHCELGAGGVAGPGDHSIPKDAWYAQTGVTKNFPNIRCQCGCFVGETNIAGISDYERIDVLAERAKVMPVGIRLFSQTRGQAVSQPLRGADFTVGPEDKPVIRIATTSGASVTLTEFHPILVQRNNVWTMIQAKNLEIADVLMNEDGKIAVVESLDSYKLDSALNKVYNLDTRAADPEDHVISANGILVGDIYWQKRLSEESSRVENLLASAQK